MLNSHARFMIFRLLGGSTFVIFALAVSTALRAADIVGTVTLVGTPPAEIPITPIMSDPYCGSLYQTAPTTHFYVVGTNGGFGDVVVSLKDANTNEITGKSTGASMAPAVLDQKGCLYSPQIFTLETGQTLLVRNSDNCIHNVHTTSKVGNPEHNDAQAPGAADLSYSFPKPEMFMKFQCDVHPWMFAWASIFDNPYYCLSGPDGKFVIKNVPPGNYTVVADHRKLGEQVQPVEVADKDVTVNFTFHVK